MNPDDAGAMAKAVVHLDTWLALREAQNEFEAALAAVRIAFALQPLDLLVLRHALSRQQEAFEYLCWCWSRHYGEALTP